MKTVSLFFFLSLVCLSSLLGDSSVWKVSKGEETLYLGGTIHVLRPGDFPLPAEFDRAYEQADTVVFETDLAATTSDAFAAALSRKMLLPSGTTLSHLLKRETYDALRDYLGSQKIDIHNVERLRPWAVMLMITQTALAQNGIDRDGVDAHYSRRASADGKGQRFLETPTEQIALITGIGEGEEDAMITQTIQETQRIPDMIEWLVRDWREGEMARIEQELVQAMRSDSPQMYHHVLKERNDAWLPRLITLMREGNTGFVLVGAMHLAGSDGLLERFKQAGYVVEHFRP
ncbi:MAG: TraB/GumN family protein [Campylobacterales bacterium]|nr:TraB/GumN family protein [Campylobacterales bacterium]